MLPGDGDSEGALGLALANDGIERNGWFYIFLIIFYNRKKRGKWGEMIKM